jgi:NAD(P)-dependent dehydrogenase (short-subunit alcohol dehydrogenase family)
LAFAKIGARLVVNGRRPAEGKALEVELRRLGAEALFIEADVRHDDEVGGLIDQAVARFPSVASQTAGRAFLKHFRLRTEQRDPEGQRQGRASANCGTWQMGCTAREPLRLSEGDQATDAGRQR